MQFVGLHVYVPCLACLLAGAFSSIIASVPNKAVVAIGSRVELNCSRHSNDNVSVHWKYTSWNSSTETSIYLGKDIVTSMSSRYKIDTRIRGQHNLIIDSVDLAHAGIYRCIAVSQTSNGAGLHLTVLDAGTNPVCAATTSKTHVDGNVHLSIWCSISYTGKCTPAFSWTKSSEQKNIAANTTNSGTELGPSISTSMITEQLQANDSGVAFQCRITFQMKNNSQGSGIAVYEYTWNYTLYGPRNISIARYADYLECSADGIPIPTYSWAHGDIEGPVFVLNRTYDKEETFECTAANIFAAKNTSYIIKASPTSTTSGGSPEVSGIPITALAIGGSLLFLLIIALIVSCAVHRKRLTDDTRERPDVALNTDVNTYDEITLSSNRSPNFILEENRSPGRSDRRTISDNAVYSEVWKPNGRLNRSSGGNTCGNAPPPQTQTREKKNLIGEDGTEYAELSGVKRPARKGEVPKPPAFSRVEVYASVDHNGKAPPPPPIL